MANTVSYIYEIMDRYSAPLRKVAKSTQRFSSMAKRAQGSAIGLSKRMDNMASKAQNLQGALGALGLGMALEEVVSISSDMEDAMQDISRVTDISDDGLARFEKTLEGMSEKLGKSKKGLAEMAFEGGKLGVSVDKMESFLMMTAKTAIAFDMLDSEAGRAIGSIQAKMGFASKETTVLLNSVNFLADTTSANGARMIEVIERLSGTFKILELPPSVSAAFAGFADQIEVTPQLAASGLSMMIRKMRDMPGMTKKMMADPVGAVNSQLEKMADMGPEIRTKFMKKVFGAEASRFVEKAVANIDLFKSTVEKATSKKAEGSMQRELENQMKRSSIFFRIFAQTWTNTMDTVGDAIIPFAVSMAKIGSELLKGFRSFAEAYPSVVKFGAGIAALLVVFTAVAAASGMLMAALSPLIGIISAFALPIAATIAGISIMATAFGEWVATGHPIIKMLKDIGNDILSLVGSFNNLIGISGDAGSEFEGLGDFITRFGYAVMGALTPLRILLHTMKGVVSAGSAILSGDFSGALSALTKSGKNVIEAGSGFKHFGTAFGGMDNANDVAKKSAQQVEVTGNIGVTASGGAKVSNAEIGLNGGSNVAYGQ